MSKVTTVDGYDFYIWVGNGDFPTLYNIVPEGSPAPGGGYPNRRFIERVKGVRFPDRYQPTLHGSSETYCSDEWSGITKRGVVR
jgi:hypothetical protein